MTHSFWRIHNGVPCRGLISNVIAATWIIRKAKCSVAIKYFSSTSYIVQITDYKMNKQTGKKKKNKTRNGRTLGIRNRSRRVRNLSGIISIGWIVASRRERECGFRLISSVWCFAIFTRLVWLWILIVVAVGNGWGDWNLKNLIEFRRLQNLGNNVHSLGSARWLNVFNVI